MQVLYAGRRAVANPGPRRAPPSVIATRSWLVIVPPIMTTDSNDAAPNGAPGPAPAEQPSETSATPPAEARAPSVPPPQTPEQKLADAQGEVARVRDQLLRTAADFDNFRKRSRRETDDA